MIKEKKKRKYNQTVLPFQIMFIRDSLLRILSYSGLFDKDRIKWYNFLQSNLYISLEILYLPFII